MSNAHVYATEGELHHWRMIDAAAALGIAVGSSTRVTRAMGLRVMRFAATTDPRSIRMIETVDLDRWAALAGADPQATVLDLLGPDGLIRRSRGFSAAELTALLKGTP